MFFFSPCSFEALDVVHVTDCQATLSAKAVSLRITLVAVAASFFPVITFICFVCETESNLKSSFQNQMNFSLFWTKEKWEVWSKQVTSRSRKNSGVERLEWWIQLDVEVQEWLWNNFLSVNTWCCSATWRICEAKLLASLRPLKQFELIPES